MECLVSEQLATGSLAGREYAGILVSGDEDDADGNGPGGRNQSEDQYEPAKDQGDDGEADDGDADDGDARATLLQVFDGLDPAEQDELLELVIQILGGPGAKKK